MQQNQRVSHNGKTQLVTINGNLYAQKYRNDILIPVVLPFMNAGNGVTMQQDNARSIPCTVLDSN